MAKNMLQKQDAAYSNLLADIRSVYVGGQTKAVQMARRQMLVTYWHIGRHIVEFEQIGEERALYGIKLIERLSTDLSHQFGKQIRKNKQSKTIVQSQFHHFMRLPPSVFSFTFARKRI